MNGFQILRSEDRAAKKLTAIRAAISHARELIRTTERAPLHRDEVRARMLDHAKHTLYRYTPELMFNGYAAYHGVPDPWPAEMKLALLVYFHGPEAFVDTILGRMEAEGHLRTDGALRSAERSEKLQTLQSDLDKLEEDEELEILALEGQGLTPLRRADARPDLLLRVWAAYTPAAAAAA